MILPRNRQVRRLAFAAAALLLGAGIMMGWRAATRPPLTVQLAAVSGFDEPMQVWMSFALSLDIDNLTGRTIGIDRIDVEPDLDGFNEAYNAAVPYLPAPIILEGHSARHYTARVTLLNATQLEEGTYPVVFRVRIATEHDGEVSAEFPAVFEYSRDPERRTLTRSF